MDRSDFLFLLPLPTVCFLGLTRRTASAGGTLVCSSFGLGFRCAVVFQSAQRGEVHFEQKVAASTTALTVSQSGDLRDHLNGESRLITPHGLNHIVWIGRPGLQALWLPASCKTAAAHQQQPAGCFQVAG
jgi:hypothetical protein